MSGSERTRLLRKIGYGLLCLAFLLVALKAAHWWFFFSRYNVPPASFRKQIEQLHPGMQWEDASKLIRGHDKVVEGVMFNHGSRAGQKRVRYLMLAKPKDFFALDYSIDLYLAPDDLILAVEFADL